MSRYFVFFTISMMIFSQSSYSRGKDIQVKGIYEDGYRKAQQLIENEYRADRESAARFETIKKESECSSNCYRIANQESDRIYVECLTGVKKGQKETIWVRNANCYSSGSVLFDSCDKNFDDTARRVCILY